ncbi:hypothetical protein [Mesorhizobium wenxiniae]|nr:hypothetical protein [Mesorhizobium wenxiniae]
MQAQQGLAQPHAMQMPQQRPQQAMPPQMAPQGQPMPQNAPQAAPEANGGGFGGLGGILQNIIAPQSAARNKTVGWLTQQGLDPGMATILASDKSALRAYVMQRSQGKTPIEINGRLVDPNTYEVLADFSEKKDPSLVNAGDGNLYDPQSKQWITAPNAGQKPPQVVELFDETTGQPYKATWNTEKREYERVGGIKARSGGTNLTVGPDGTVTYSEGGAPGMPKLSEAEGRNAGFYGRAAESHKLLADLEREGTSLFNKTVGDVPLVGNYALSQDAQKFKQAQRDFINAVLRRESGAVISPEEFENAKQQYFPQPGDGPEVIAQKRKNRDTTITGLKISGGQGSQFAVPAAPPPAGATPPAAALPKVGESRYGYRFKGGDPSEPSNWEKAN